LANRRIRSVETIVADPPLQAPAGRNVLHCLKLRVAAVQMTSVNRAVEANLRRAEALAEKAAKQGAQLALLPELFAAGFELNEHAWETAEPQGGGIERWLCGTGAGRR